MNTLIIIPLVFAGLVLLWFMFKLLFDYIDYRIELNKKKKQEQNDLATKLGLTPTPIKIGWFKKFLTHKIQSKLDYGMGMSMGVLIMTLILVMQPYYPFIITSIHGGNVYSKQADQPYINQTIQNLPPELTKYNYAANYAINDYVGEYNAIFDSMEIRDYDNMQEIIIHEIGHRIWFKILTSEQREDYTIISKTQLPITEYSKTNIKEDFAETFECYYDYHPSPNGGWGCRTDYNITKRIKWIETNKETWE